MLNIKRKKTFSKKSKLLVKEKDIPSLNTSVPAKVQKPRKVFVKDKAALLSILEQVNRKLDDEANIKRERMKDIMALKQVKQAKRETRELYKKNKKQKKWEEAVAKVKQKKRNTR
ncbi:uncharacterized protein T551_02476 [Pneumocystis jirovecii RU7]|uniref:Uncharacterized protein n=1 Tax=Pneumocystis jirovecii (strain RU7) TaxID=1408657 RepID=A0A0W4ZJS2_PNEJ7|nr:uncharacterized protein T551_02476 [Pneumocystis jirovecii RU7]KTW28626.1 hypothetical protein T551_02476 [Pneumocystis jirovecii RU7]